MKPNQPSPPGWKLSLGALAVVYADIGTSPLYALKECFRAEYGLVANATDVFGILSLIFWSLILVVTVKHLMFILRADNQGQGGILALVAPLIPSGHDVVRGMRRRLLLLGLFGAALLYGDGVITPAISVLSAVEGAKILTSQAHHYVVPISAGILIALFLFQRRGTAGIGALFGPIMLLWFATLAITGVVWIAHEPSVLWAIDPRHAVRFFAQHRGHGFFVLGAVVLCITGGEAIYADLGHFGRAGIRRAWFLAVLPALVLNYFGQGALLLRSGTNPSLLANPFFNMVPHWAVAPLLALAIVAAIIASQSLISKIFSLTRQAVQLGFWPRVRIIHTAEKNEGQIYIPSVNWALLAGSLILVLEFRTASGLAAAYGTAVSAAMAIVSVLFAAFALRRFSTSSWRIGVILVAFLIMDIAFLIPNLTRIDSGGWVPLAIGAALFTMMTTWREGRDILYKLIQAETLPIDLLLPDLASAALLRVPGTAVFVTENTDGVPNVLLHHVKHCKSLHEQVVLLRVLGERVPIVPPDKQLAVEDLGQEFYRITLRHGFMQTVDVPAMIQKAAKAGHIGSPSAVSYYLGRETLVTSGHAHMRKWRKAVFAFLQRNARSATEFFGLPPRRVVELGAQMEI